VLVRCAFAEDSQLKPLNIVVVVRSNVATLTGFVPSRELARRAVTTAKRVPQILDVRDRLLVQNQDGMIAMPDNIRPNQPILPPTDLAALQADKAVKPVRWPTMWRPAMMDPASISVAVGSAFLPSFQSAKPGGNTTSWMKAPPAAEAGSIETAVAAILVADKQYRGLRYEVKDGVVYLSGTIAAWNDLARLFSDLRRLEGVRDVLLRAIEVAPLEPPASGPTLNNGADKAESQNSQAP
jgi:BON domain